MEKQVVNENEKENVKTTNKGLFWLRLILFIIFSTIAPCVYLIVRFNLFQTTTKTQIGLWGVIVIAIVLCSIGMLCKFYLDSMKTRYAYFKQVVSGLIKVIFPLILILAISIWLKDNVEEITYAMYCIIPCEIIAIFINPLPKWCFDNNVEGLGEIVDKVFLDKSTIKKDNSNDAGTKE